jgi:VWFA-related protein
MVYTSSIIYSEPPLTLAITKKMVCAQSVLGFWTAGRVKALAIAAFIGCLATLCEPLRAASKQQPLAQNGNSKIYLDVVVTPKSGPPVGGLQQQDFTLLDNKAPQTITSFRALQGSTAPAEVIVVVDAVNMPYEKIPYERDQIDKFFHANGGRLANPTAVAFFTDTDTRIEDTFVTDGNVVSNFLDQYELALQTIHRTTGFYGALERFQLSTKVLGSLAAREAPSPARKIILWVSPGWPFLAATDAKTDLKQRSEIFANIVRLSTQLREARITLYAIDPLPEGFLVAPLPAGNPYRRDLPASGRGPGAPVIPGSDITFSNLLYKDFLKGVTDARQADTGNLALQVLAVQSGGLALTGSKYVDDLMGQAIADTENYYEISFDPPAAKHPDEYHQIQIKLAKSGLTARTRQGFYAQPVSP